MTETPNQNCQISPPPFVKRVSALQNDFGIPISGRDRMDGWDSRVGEGIEHISGANKEAH